MHFSTMTGCMAGRRGARDKCHESLERIALFAERHCYLNHAGFRPGSRVPFLACPRKGTKRRAPRLGRSAFADSSAVLGLEGSRKTRYAAFGRCAQTVARSQIL